MLRQERDPAAQQKGAQDIIVVVDEPFSKGSSQLCYGVLCSQSRQVPVAVAAASKHVQPPEFYRLASDVSLVMLKLFVSYPLILDAFGMPPFPPPPPYLLSEVACLACS